MKTIDKLIIKAKKQCEMGLKLSCGMISPCEEEPGKWVARGELWNYIPYNKQGHRLEFATCICDSVDDALDALNELSEQYPNKNDITIIVDDLVE